LKLFEFDLKSIEKIKIKAIRKSPGKRKTKFGPASPA
jgi:hypothetical protein